MNDKDDKKGGLSRRAVTAAGATGIVGLTVFKAVSTQPAQDLKGLKMSSSNTRMPVIYVPHGGGPWPFMDSSGMLTPREFESLRSYLAELPKHLPAKPKALLVISAHWEEKIPTVMTNAAPPMFYDYGGFPPETYKLQWPAPGDPLLAQRVVARLTEAGIPVAADENRGFDHGTFIPFMLSWPAAEIPTIQLSMTQDYDPGKHLELGRALAPFRDEGVLILGSGMSFHSFRSWRTGTSLKDSQPFDAWLKAAATAEPDTRNKQLIDWASAPGARVAHPREDHLLPLMVIAGAAGNDIGRVTYNDDFMQARLSAFQYG